jgi:hypothetical protein
LLGRRRAAQALDVAHDQGQTITLGQTAQFGVEQRAEFAASQSLGRIESGSIGGVGDDPVLLLSFAPTATAGAARGVDGETSRDAVKPTRQRFASTNGSGPAGKHEEHRLKSVIRVGAVAEDAAADAADHGSVSSQQLLEGGLVALGNEAAEQIVVSVRLRSEAAQVAQELGYGSTHASRSGSKGAPKV